MRAATTIVVLVALTAGAGCSNGPAAKGEPVAAPARAENDSAYAKGLIKLRWLDLAERLLIKTGEKNKVEAALGWAYLYQDRGDHAASPREQIEFYEKALASLEDFRKVAPANHPAAADALNLKAAVMQAEGRSLEALIADPKTEAAEIQKLVEKRNKTREEATAAYKDAVQKTEAAYAEALCVWRERSPADSKGAEAEKQKDWVEYVCASQLYFNKLLRDAERQEPGSAEQKAAGKTIYTKVNEWVRKQNEEYETIGDESAGVTMYMDYALGRGYAYAGDMIKACKRFDDVIAFDSADFPEGPARAFVNAIRLHSMYFKADGLATTAQTEADWRKALEAIGDEMFLDLPGSDPVMRVKARILRARCHSKLGEPEKARSELEKALKEAEKSDKAGALKDAIFKETP